MVNVHIFNCSASNSAMNGQTRCRSERDTDRDRARAWHEEWMAKVPSNVKQSNAKAWGYVIARRIYKPKLSIGYKQQRD